MKLNAQPYIKLQEVAEEISLEDPNWQIVDDNFSQQKRLFDYQKQALENAVKVLWKYFEDLKGDKRKFSEYYEGINVEEYLNIPLKNNKYAELLKEYFNTYQDEYIPFSEISNRMSFWMATGSGKTIVIVKLIEILHNLMRLNLIPKKEILFLTYREDLIDSFKKLVEEYNYGKSLGNQIKLVNLKEYETEKPQNDFSNRVFNYRSDLISDERKENILNFDEYLEKINNKKIGNWYLILDEAHKGDKQDSKRQHIFSILSQNGFLFNFSATFTQAIDIITTVYNFNLEQFIKSGYGKQIYISQEEMKAFQDKTDFNEDAKKKIILKTLITLSAVKKAYKEINEENLYHNPLLIYLMNSVNTENSDLKLVFKQLADIGKSIDDNTFNTCKQELLNDLNNGKYTIGDESYTLKFTGSFIQNLKKQDIYQIIYNSTKEGNIEYIVNPNNKQEIALKLDSSAKPFALIKIGDISNWIKENLQQEYKENKTFKDEGYFETLNDKESPINILLGSRAFYEGWDSNRPNVIVFINIGTGNDAKKFVLQSIGRGVRIEPIPNERKRLDRLSINNEDLQKIKDKYTNQSKLLETLFIYATNKNAVETILKELELIKASEGFEKVSLWKNEERINQIKPDLLIPSYRRLKEKLTNLSEDKIVKFRMSKSNLELLKLYLQLMPIEKFLMEYGIDLQTYTDIQEILKKSSKYILEDENRHYKDLSMLIKSLITYINSELEECDGFIPVNDKIVHFSKIKVRSDLKDSFLKEAEKVRNAMKIDEDDILERLQKGKLSKEKAKELLSKKNNDKTNFEGIELQKLIQHFYIPIVYTQNKVDWIKHIINVSSEYEFIKDLINKLDELDKHFDWWMFSKLDEHLDESVYIPYFSNGKIKKFIPDFIFWFKKSNKYSIVFIDPKGSSHSSYLEKVDGYKAIFEDNNGNEKVFKLKNGLEITVKLLLYTEDTSNVSGGQYNKYWVDKESLLDKLKEKFYTC